PLVDNDIDKPVAFVASYTNKRKLNQRGCFIIYGKNKSELDTFSETNGCLDYITIKINNKKKILDELNLLYINDYSVYPDYQGMDRMIKKYGSLFNYKTFA
ncbi:MAG: hypothetical protein JXJ04_04105, partial [Spirochaetales bacterium]|nr:hypothetical protein [Spirochaetales bacterium]